MSVDRGSGNDGGRQDGRVGYDALEDRIIAAFPEMTGKQRRIARVLLEEHPYSAFASADDLGRRAGVNAATIVRFAQMLGFSGWVELRQVVRDGVPSTLTAAEKVSSSSRATDGCSSLLAEIVDHDIRNIRQTAILNSAEVVAGAVERILAARKVLIIGLGLESVMADTLYVQLRRTGVPAYRVPGNVAFAALVLTPIDEDDVVIAVALWRYVADTVRMFEKARRQGAHGIALTDRKLAPVARAADTVLLAAESAPHLSHSMTGMLSLINLLASGVALTGQEQARRRLERIDGALRDLNVFTE